MNLNRPEILEEYLRGQLSEAERKAFEAQLEQDPLIQSELDLQRDIVNSLKEYRKAQLKQRLSNIDISSPAVSYTVLKVAASLIFTALIGFGIYYFMSLPDEGNKVIAKEATEQIVQPAIEEPKEVAEESSLLKSESSQDIEDTTTVLTPRAPTQEKIESRELVIEPNVTNSFTEGPLVAKDREAEELQSSKNPITDKFSNVEILNEDSRGKELKYKYLNKKLYLYGDFSAAPYELLEFNLLSDKKLYLFHSGVYYQLNENQKNISPLQALKDKNLTKELDSLREHH